MRVVVVPDDPSGDGVLSGVLQVLDDDGQPDGPARATADLTGEIARLERERRPRWVWADTAVTYPVLLRDGVRVERCHDVALTEGLLLGHQGRGGEPANLAASWLRLQGGAPDRTETGTDPDSPAQPSLFSLRRDPLPAGIDPLTALVGIHRSQCERLPTTCEISPGMALLVAAESASALCAAEMTRAGLPWRSDVHDRLLTEALGPRPAPGARPPVLASLARQIADALDAPQLNPDSPADVLRAFARQGIALESTRKWVLRRLDHPAVVPLLRYKELSRLHAANGWAWREQWVHDGRFRPEYVPGGVVSGRWSSRGGGALQIPRAVRSAVVADPGHVLVVADARQLEPRVLAAMSGDAAMARASAADGPGGGDLYSGLAAQAFSGDRDKAKVALLSAMYGGGSGGSGAPAMATLRRRFPAALALVESAARTGEDGGLVRSVLGRTCPPPSPGWRDGPEDLARRRARDRGRFTRNFVVQASAADWASALLAGLRGRLASIGDTDPAPGASELVFFQHDEVIVHAPLEAAGAVTDAVHDAAEHATRLVFGTTPVRFPMAVTTVPDYASAK